MYCLVSDKSGLVTFTPSPKCINCQCKAEIPYVGYAVTVLITAFLINISKIIATRFRGSSNVHSLNRPDRQNVTTATIAISHGELLPGQN